MARPKKTETTATEAAQETQDAQQMSRDAQESETASEAAESGQDEVSQEIIGPDGPEELLGCQDEADLEGTEFIEYAVTAEGGLRLREEPSLDAPVVAVLPCGVGVLGSASPAENGWRQVFTGRLSGWVKDEFLERLALPELDQGAE